jgi:hypothetical protein
MPSLKLEVIADFSEGIIAVRKCISKINAGL